MMEIYEEIWPDLDSNGFQAAYDLTIGLMEPVIFMMSRGIAVDLDALELTKQEISDSIRTKQLELNTLCGREVNVNSPKDMQKYFYIELGIPPYYNEGSITVDDTALQRLSRPTARRAGLRQAKLVQEIRGLMKLKGTYLEIEFDQDKRIRCSYNLRGTKFGRLSSSKTIFGTGGNLQNLPQEFKKFLVADPGYVFWEIDLQRAEWVVVAYLSNDANMLSVIDAGLDPHIHTASLMFKKDKELITREAKVVGNNSDPDLISSLRLEAGLDIRIPRTMSMRQCAKKANHGLNYGEGPNKFALINEMEPNEAKIVVELYHNIYPGIRLWYESTKRQLQKERTLTNCFGRRVRFMGAWDEDLWKAAYSFIPQSTVVDSLNIGMKKIYENEWITKTCGVDLLAQVHDSVLVQLPISVFEGKEFLKLKQLVYDYVTSEMSYHNRVFRLGVDSKIGTNWSGHHAENNPGGMTELK